MTPQRRRLAIVGVLAVVAIAIAFFVGRGDGGDNVATDTTSTTSSTTEATTSSTVSTTTESTTSTTDGSSETTETTATSSTTAAPPSTSPSGDGPPRAPSGSAFANAVTAQFENRGLDAAQACNVANPGVRRVLTDYGAVYVARGVTAPTACIFAGPSATDSFQNSVAKASATIGGVPVTLQRPAMAALQDAVNEASSRGLNLTPRGDSSAAARSFETSHQYWLSRVEPGLDRYVSEGRISSSYADEIRAMGNLDQVAAILDLEAQGMLFGLNQNGSIMSSVAPPGSSQHHSLLAFDVAEFANGTVRSILASHGWFQTVISDEPHFTYLGASESELPSLGLRSVSEGGYTYWIPAV